MSDAYAVGGQSSLYHLASICSHSPVDARGSIVPAHRAHKRPPTPHNKVKSMAPDQHTSNSYSIRRTDSHGTTMSTADEEETADIQEERYVQEVVQADVDTDHHLPLPNTLHAQVRFLLNSHTSPY